MAWEENLFAVLDDLEQQAEALYDAERVAELADRSRAEYGAVTFASRLMASVGSEVVLGIAGVGRVPGELQRLGTGWALLRGVSGDWVVHLGAVEEVLGASARSVPEVAWSPLTRLGLGSALRRLSEAGERCLVHLRSGARLEGAVLRVGADFAEVEAAPGGVRLVAFGALAAVQSRE
ncbi:hypothetical protein [Nocardioides sp. GXQ0305]|uniref:hypothetical protein n=1 Tax=Nocardioides sp. GXQ0305 TaxID=3423912 RepID=UPI003D7E38EA